MEPLLGLAEQVVRHLSNHCDSHLRYGFSRGDGVSDYTLRFRGDSALIIICPLLEPEEKLTIMLLKCALIRSHYSGKPIRWEGIVEQADEWLAWVENNAWKHKRSDTRWMEAALWSLLGW